MATRVFELAKELDVTSKAILDKCRAEDIELKNHMATLTKGLEATIREWFAEGNASTAVETSEHVDLEQERQKAKKQRRRRGSETAEHGEEAHAAEDAALSDEAAPAEAPAVAAAPAQEEPPASADTAVPAPVAPAASNPAPVSASTAPVAPAAAAPAPAAPAASAPALAAPAEAKPAAPAAPVSKPSSTEKAAPPAPPAVAALTPPPAPHSKRDRKGPLGPKAEIRPAGPQLVPRPAKLQGPRVVRVEKPDFVEAPPPRRRPSGPSEGPVPSAGGPPRFKKPPVVVVDEEEEANKKKRSPRRRGGRSAESGVIEGLKEWRDRDLAERDQRLAAATTGGLRRHRASVGGHGAAGSSGSMAKSGQVEIEPPLTVKNLAAALGIKAAMIIRKLMEMGTMANVNQALDAETAQTLVLDYGVELVIKKPKTAEEELIEKLEARPKSNLELRAPVVTILGHVDHGKTSLLDRIRKTTVASGEAGGITQHIGAYRYDMGDKHVVFLDTPGHEAFTAMRSRGANMTDVVVLVVAADDGVMPQTVESISHAKAAGVPIVVALNKVDVPNANIPRAMGQLAEHGLQPREWGGNVEVIQTSAATGLGIDTLIETLSLEAEILELKAEKDAPASGFVIEAQMDQGLGVLARLLVRNGTLRVGDVLWAGASYGRVRHMIDSHGQPIEEAGPSTPVEVAGLDSIPEAGDKFFIVEDIEQARKVAEDRRSRDRSESLGTSPAKDLQGLLNKIAAGKINELALIIKADVQGSIEAIVGSLNKLATDEVKVNILHAAVGGITTGDVSLADASNALIIGFNAVPDSSARQLAERTGVDIRQYRIIYDIIDDITKALEEGLAPETREQVLGHAEVRQVFKVSRVGTIAGCYVIDGLANRNAKVRITRNNIVVEDSRTLESLKRFKDDVREVRTGFECGLKVAGYDDIKEGDVLEFYQQVEVARKL